MAPDPKKFPALFRLHQAREAADGIDLWPDANAALLSFEAAVSRLSIAIGAAAAAEILGIWAAALPRASGTKRRAHRPVGSKQHDNRRLRELIAWIDGPDSVIPRPFRSKNTYLAHLIETNPQLYGAPVHSRAAIQREISRQRKAIAKERIDAAEMLGRTARQRGYSNALSMLFGLLPDLPSGELDNN